MRDEQARQGILGLREYGGILGLRGLLGPPCLLVASQLL